jgi:hypothetical protein
VVNGYSPATKWNWEGINFPFDKVATPLSNNGHKIGSDNMVYFDIVTTNNIGKEIYRGKFPCIYSGNMYIP